MKRPVDVHQHLWPPALVEELRRRRQPPYLDGWVLHLDGEPPYAVDPADHDLTRRAAQEDGASTQAPPTQVQRATCSAHRLGLRFDQDGGPP